MLDFIGESFYPQIARILADFSFIFFDLPTLRNLRIISDLFILHGNSVQSAYDDFHHSRPQQDISLHRPLLYEAVRLARGWEIANIAEVRFDRRAAYFELGFCIVPRRDLYLESQRQIHGQGGVVPSAVRLVLLLLRRRAGGSEKARQAGGANGGGV